MKYPQYPLLSGALISISGVSLPGNRRPSRLRARKTREINATIPRKQPHVEMLSDSVSAYSKNSSLSSTKDYVSFTYIAIDKLGKVISLQY